MEVRATNDESSLPEGHWARALPFPRNLGFVVRPADADRASKGSKESRPAALGLLSSAGVGQLAAGSLPGGAAYPIFNKFPTFVVDFQVKERERIRQEELEYLRQRAVALESKRQTEHLRLEEHAWSRQQELLVDAEEERRCVYCLLVVLIHTQPLNS